MTFTSSSGDRGVAGGTVTKLMPVSEIKSALAAPTTAGSVLAVSATPNKGSNCHFDSWCSLAAATSFAPCVLNSFSTKVVDADTVQYLISVPAGAQPTACNVSIQPRVANNSGGCGANAGPLLTLSPAFSLK